MRYVIQICVRSSGKFGSRKSTDSTTNIHDITLSSSISISDNRPKTASDEEFVEAMDSTEQLSISVTENRLLQRDEINQPLEMTIDIVKSLHSKLRVTNKAQKDEEPEEFPHKRKKTKKRNVCQNVVLFC